MDHDQPLRYGMFVPLPRILAHPRFTALSKQGLELRRAAARALNDRLLATGITRASLGVRFAASHLPASTFPRNEGIALTDF